MANDSRKPPTTSGCTPNAGCSGLASAGRFGVGAQGWSCLPDFRRLSVSGTQPRPPRQVFARGDDSPECKPEWLRDRTARAGYLADQPRRAARRRTCPSLRCVTTLASACTYSSMIRRNGTVGISRRACNVSGPNLKGLLELGCSAIDCRSRLPSTTVTGAPYEISRLRSSRASCVSSRRSRTTRLRCACLF